MGGMVRLSIGGRYASSFDIRGAGVATAGLWMRPRDGACWFVGI